VRPQPPRQSVISISDSSPSPSPPPLPDSSPSSQDPAAVAVLSLLPFQLHEAAVLSSSRRPPGPTPRTPSTQHPRTSSQSQRTRTTAQSIPLTQHAQPTTPSSTQRGRTRTRPYARITLPPRSAGRTPNRGPPSNQTPSTSSRLPTYAEAAAYPAYMRDSRCYHCDRIGHFREWCPAWRCNICGRQPPRHTLEQCPERDGRDSYEYDGGYDFDDAAIHNMDT